MKKSSEVLLVAAALLLSFVIPSLKAGSEVKEEKIAVMPVSAASLTEQQKTALHELRQQARVASHALSPADKLAKLRELKQGYRDQARLITAPESGNPRSTHRT